jgi:[ribosomal protein S5]-alanine N-acetyltransferase
MAFLYMDIKRHTFIVVTLNSTGMRFTPFPEINTGRLLLRQITAADIPTLFLLRSNSQVLQYLDREPEASEQVTATFIQHVHADIELGKLIMWAICLNTEQPLIGTIGIWNWQQEHRRAEIGYMLHPGLQRKGIMDEALKAVLDFGFQKMNLHSLEATVNPANIASIQLLKKNGFVQEAYFKENHCFRGRFMDTAVYSLLHQTKL